MDTTLVSSTAFDGTPHAPAAARRFVRDVLADWHLRHIEEDAVLLTSELVTNAVVHAGTGIEVTCRLDSGASPPRLEIEVDDHHPSRVILAAGHDPVEALTTSGRGLAMASMLADAWGVTYTRAAKRVWVRIDLMEGPAGPQVAGPPASAPAMAVAPVESLRVAVIVADGAGQVISWNSEAEELLGWPAGEASGLPLDDLVAWRSHGPYALTLGDMLELGRWHGESRMRHHDGRLLPVYISHLRTDGRTEERRAVWMVVAEPHRYVLAPAPVPLRREVGRRVTEILDSGRPLGERLEDAAGFLQISCGADAAYVLVRGEEGFTLAAGAGTTAGLVGVLATGVFSGKQTSPVMVDDLLATDVQLAEQLRGRSLACAPLTVAGEVTGYLVVTASDPGRFDTNLAAGLQHVADQVAVQIERERSAEHDRAHRGRLSFLAEAGELLAGVNDGELIAALTAQLVVPKIAMWAAVYLTDLGGRTRLTHVWHAEERHNAALRNALPSAPQAELGDTAWPPGFATVLSFPLLTAGRSHGALVIGRAEPLLSHEMADLLADLCRLVALNLQSAALYARQEATSRVLQRSLLPVRASALPGLESAVVYEPAEEGAHVGGDFYDLFTVAGHWCFALGDVCGSGPEAAAITGLARHAVRLLAKERYSVADILDRLNQTILDEAEDGRFISLLCGALTPLPDGGARCTIASAGHPPPLLLRGGGEVSAVASPQLLLGIQEGIAFFDETFELGADDVLLCVTDGVTERRNGKRLLDDDDGLARILAGCGGLSAHAVAERVRQAVEGFAVEPSHDDVAMLVLKAVRTVKG
ncbi:SpoIIE family protein phosphatase [Nonomuraea sp. NBC_01738]|uniref:SpoIIE family protein phosphatase n=1 Tax=Nonomuraea sp. NBC_01738 TaxID=2976003 RepID=UPI002E13B2A7|nr:SpoIIE family protein phosphatase [Nonomuraea sp. NBC_01738]